MESRLPLLADSPDPLRDPLTCAFESRLPLRCDSTELLRRSVEATITVFWSLLRQIRAISAAIVLPDSRRDLVDADFTPESADDSRRLRYAAPTSVGFAQGSDRARSAKVSLRTRGLLPRVLLVEPPHSRRMSVSCAKELRRRRAVAGGEVS